MAKKGPTGQSRAPLQQYRVGAPMDRVAVDVLGPFPLTPRGNRFVAVLVSFRWRCPAATRCQDPAASFVSFSVFVYVFVQFFVCTLLHVIRALRAAM